MRRLKLSLAFTLIVISSLFLVSSISSYLTSYESLENNFSITNKATYTVIHKKQNLNGTYTTYSEESIESVLGRTVTVPVLSFEGFDSPSAQTITLDTFSNNVVTYLYDRKELTLTINDSSHVTTDTPSGTYLYGTPIRLVADPDSGGNAFVMWSDGSTDRDYTFTLTEDKTIGPIYANSYHITFEPNNGEAQTFRDVIEDTAIGTLPTPVKETCTTTTGDTYLERGCTDAYRLVGWFLEPDFQTQVNETFIPTGDTTLYAKWEKVYYHHEDAFVFDGNSFIDTQIKLFSEENAEKNFIVSFVVDDFPSGQAERTVIFANMSEVGDPYPGVQFRWFNNGYNINANTNGSKKNKKVNYTVGNKVVLKRENDKFYYSLDGGNTFTQYNDYSNLTSFFDVTATFGAQYDADGGLWRFMQGTLSDMTVELIEPDYYTIHYVSNGGSGMMIDQNVRVDKTVNLKDNVFINENHSFSSWNTAPDGSGTTYTNKQSITGIANVGETVTLYAQWIEATHYTIHFDGHGGTGTMPDQVLYHDQPATALNAFDFTRPGYIFKEWNTKADGSGTSYQDGELVRNLTDVPDGEITLYAIYWRVAYTHTGNYTFDGVDDIIDTGVNLYADEQTMNKDFIIRFTVESVDPGVDYQHQATIISCKDESNNKWPGFNIRFNTDSATLMRIGHKWNNGNSSTTLPGISTTNNPVTFVFTRTGDIVKSSYSYEGYQSNERVLYDQTSWKLTKYFTDNITFGGIYNSNHQPDRYFKGTLSNMTILVEE